MHVKEFFKNGNLALQVNLQTKAFLEVSLMDDDGNLIYNYFEFVRQGFMDHLISQDYLPKGNFVLRVAANGSSLFNKMIPGNFKMAG